MPRTGGFKVRVSNPSVRIRSSIRRSPPDRGPMGEPVDAAAYDGVIPGISYVRDSVGHWSRVIAGETLVQRVDDSTVSSRFMHTQVSATIGMIIREWVQRDV